MKVFWFLVAVAIGGVLVWQGRPWLEQRTAPAVEAVPRVVAPRGDLAADEKSTIELFERAKGSVVFITTTQLVRDFWSRNMFSIPRGAGSGFVWDNDGHVVTNSHVIRGAAEAKVRLNDGRDYGAKLVGASPAHEIAVLRIRVPERQPPPLPIGESAELKVEPGSPAEAAGLQGARTAPDGSIVPGDVITALDGKPVDSAQRLVNRLDERRIGDTVRLTVRRDGKQTEVSATLKAGA